MFERLFNLCYIYVVCIEGFEVYNDLYDLMKCIYGLFDEIFSLKIYYKIVIQFNYY